MEETPREYDKPARTDTLHFKDIEDGDNHASSRTRLVVFIATSVFCVSLLTGCMILIVYYSDKQHAISRIERRDIAEKEARVEGTLVEHGILIDRLQNRVDRLERKIDLILMNSKNIDSGALDKFEK
jgi:hypothetical protein